MYKFCALLAAICCCASLARADDVPTLADKLAGSDPLAVKAARQTLDALVHHAAAPGADAERKTVASALAQLLDDKRPDSMRREVLNWLGYIGGDEQVPVIAPLLRGAAGLADDARMAIERIPGTVAEDALIEALPSAAPSVKPGILAALSRRHVKRGLDAMIREARSATDKELAWTAFDAITAMGVPPNAICPPPVNGSQEELARYARGWSRVGTVFLQQGDMLNAERTYIALASSAGSPAQKCAALVGLNAAHSTKAVDMALGYLGEPAVHATAKQVLIDVQGDAATDRMQRAYPLLASGVRATLIDVLVARKAPSLSALLPEAAKDDAPEVRIAAARATGQAPADADLDAVIKNGSPWARNIAADIALARAEKNLADGNPEGARATFEQIAQTRLAESVLVRAWRGVEHVGSAASLHVVEDAAKAYANVQPPVVSNEFTTARTRAYISVIAAQPEKDNAIAKLIEISANADPAIGGLVLEKLRGLGYDTQRAPQQHGFLTAWKIAGPISDPENKGFDTSYFDETFLIPYAGIVHEGQRYPWEEVIADCDPSIVDLGARYGGKQNAVAYGYTTLRVAAAMPIVFLVGSNDGCEVYLNGKRIHGVDGQRALKVDNDRFEGQLKAGVNTILIKVIQQGGGWQFCMRLANPDNSPFDVTQLRP